MSESSCIYSFSMKNPNVGSWQTIAMRCDPWRGRRGTARWRARAQHYGGGALDGDTHLLISPSPSSTARIHHTSYQSGKQKVNIESKIQASASDMYHLSCSTRPSTARPLSGAQLAEHRPIYVLTHWRDDDKDAFLSVDNLFMDFEMQCPI